MQVYESLYVIDILIEWRVKQNPFSFALDADQSKKQVIVVFAELQSFGGTAHENPTSSFG
jgi:hypothetical protein